MEAIEFITGEEGGSIKIPKRYLSRLPKKFRVLILVDEVSPLQQEDGKKNIVKKRKFTAARIKTKGFKFNRDEANER